MSCHRLDKKCKLEHNIGHRFMRFVLALATNSVLILIVHAGNKEAIDCVVNMFIKNVSNECG